jgi:drug/metabolite transporter (DMT)-like permease
MGPGGAGGFLRLNDRGASGRGWSDEDARPRLPGHAAILTTVVLWGSLIPLLDVLLAHIDVFALSMIRYGVAGTLLLGGLWIWRGTAWLRTLPIGRVFLLGICGICGFGTLYTLAIAASAPGMAIVIASATPVVSALFAALVYRLPFAKGTGVAFALAAIGAATASLGRQGATFTFDLRGGEPLFVLAAICWAWYSINAQAWLGAFSQLQLTAVTMATAGIGVFFVFLVAAGLGASHFPARPPDQILALLAFITIGSTLVGVLCWNFAVDRLGVIIASLYLNLLPVVGMMTAAAIGHPPTAMQLIGGAIVITGIAQLQLRRLCRPTPAEGLSPGAHLSHTRR